jgi:hypothetical protein
MSNDDDSRKTYDALREHDPFAAARLGQRTAEVYRVRPRKSAPAGEMRPDGKVSILHETMSGIAKGMESAPARPLTPGEAWTRLTDSQREAVRTIVGDDPKAQLEALERIGPSWGYRFDSAAEAPGTRPPTPAPHATTSRAAPGGNAADHHAAYARLRASDPFAAARYAAAHPDVYTPPKGAA